MRLINWRCRFPSMILSLVVFGIFLILPSASADEGNTQQKKDVDELTPRGTLQELPSLPRQTGNSPSAPVPAPSAPENQGAINPRTGKYYPPSGQGVINPGTGAYYPHAR